MLVHVGDQCAKVRYRGHLKADSSGSCALRTRWIGSDGVIDFFLGSAFLSLAKREALRAV